MSNLQQEHDRHNDRLRQILHVENMLNHSHGLRKSYLWVRLYILDKRIDTMSRLVVACSVLTVVFAGAAVTSLVTHQPGAVFFSILMGLVLVISIVDCRRESNEKI